MKFSLRHLVHTTFCFVVLAFIAKVAFSLIELSIEFYSMQDAIILIQQIYIHSVIRDKNATQTNMPFNTFWSYILVCPYMSLLFFK